MRPVDKMKVTVIISTYNGVNKIINVMHSLENQTVKPDEVLVVIDGSTDGTANFLRNEKFNLKEFRFIEQENGGRAKVRNAGAGEATGDLLVFFDDDMIPGKDCLLEHIKHHQEKNNSILTGAQIDKNDQSSTDFQKFKSYLSEKWSKDLIANGNEPLLKEKSFITAANFSVSRNLFLALGGFDEQLSDAEDFDLGVRAKNTGVALYYNHDAFAWHHDSLTGISYVKRLRQYRKAHLQLKQLKPGLFREFPKHLLVQPQGLKNLFFLFFATRFWINWLDSSLFKGLIPRFIRYKVYDWIITSNGVYFPEQVKIEN